MRSSSHAIVIVALAFAISWAAARAVVVLRAIERDISELRGPPT